MVGPSRPTAPPPITKAKLERILNTIILMLRRCRIFVCSFGFASSTAAITCGIPLPFEYGANSFTSHQDNTKPIGAIMKIIHAFQSIIKFISFSPQVKSFAYITAKTPVISDPIQNGTACNRLCFSFSFWRLSKDFLILRRR